MRDKFQKSMGEAGGFNSDTYRGEISRGGHFRERNHFPRGKGGELKCYDFGKPGHMSWECPEKKNAGVRETHISKVQQRNMEMEMKAEAVEEGRSLMVRKVLVNPEKEVQEPIQRNNLFITSCKTRKEYAR
jgi:hypothetical protein